MSSNGSLRNVAGGGVKFGLIKRTSGSSSSGAVGAGAARGRAPFGDAAEEDDDSADDSAAAGSARRPAAFGHASQAAQRVVAAALAEDAAIFDYDAAFDATRAAVDAARRKRDMGGDAGSDARKKPRYVGALLAAAQQRKIELERVEDRKVARERELEGEEFKDKDAFVTDAFKKHKDDMRKLEEEEERKAKLAKSAGGDMSVFYRTVLDQHEQIATNSHLSKKDLELAAKEREQRNREKLLEEKEKMEDAVRRGELKINANNEIVDKRALLKSGLNISKTKVRTLNEEREADERDRRKAEDERRAKERQERDRKHAEMEKRRQKEEQARRLLEETERQKRESDRKRAQEIAKEKEQVAATMAKKATEEVVMDARARYLARKKQEQEQQRSGKDEDDSD